METTTNFTTCKNCTRELLGDYCHHCGEKIVEDKDFTLKTILQQFFDGITSIDSKIIRSFKYLLLKPGKLTKHYIEGLRKPFMKPIQLFIVINLMFFFFLPKADILRIPSTYYFRSEYSTKALKAASQNTGISELELKHQYDTKSLTYSKSAVIIIIPFLAVMFALINFTNKLQFGKHVIFATHYFSFFLIFCVLLLFVPFVDGNSLIIQLAILVFNFLYLFVAIKTFYQNRWLISGLKALAGVVGCISIALLYRSLISNVSFMLIK